MKITTAKKGMTLVNKVNGKAYEVTEWDGTVAKAVSINPETNKMFEKDEDGYDTVEVNEANSICFRTLHIPEDESTLEGYTVKNGELLLNDKAVTVQGEIVVEDIIAALPGYLVLAVKPREKKDDLIDLFIFEPERDKFTKLIRGNSIPMPKTVKALEGAILLGYNETHLEEVPDEDGVVTEVEFFDRGALMLIANRKLNSVFFERPMDFTNLLEVAGAGLETTFLISTTKTADVDGRIEDSKMYYEKVSVDVKYASVSSTALWNQPRATVTSAAICHVADGGIVLKGADFIQYGEIRINTPFVANIKGEYLVDITRDGDDEIYTFADEKYAVTRLKRTRTKDRGYIYSIM